MLNLPPTPIQPTKPPVASFVVLIVAALIEPGATLGSIIIVGFTIHLEGQFLSYPRTLASICSRTIDSRWALALPSWMRAVTDTASPLSLASKLIDDLEHLLPSGRGVDSSSTQ